MQYTNLKQPVEPPDREAVELEHIIHLIDTILYSLHHAPWAYDRDGALLDTEAYDNTLDGPKPEAESQESLQQLKKSLELRQEFQRHAGQSPFSFQEYEEVKRRSVPELSGMSWQEVEELLLKEEKWRVLSIMRQGTCVWCPWKVPEMIPDEYLLRLIAFRYGDIVERMKREEEFRNWACNIIL